MPIKSISLEALESKVDNIYEAIVVLSKRAQQINEEIKIEFNQRLEIVQSKLMSEDSDEPETMETVTNPEQVVIAREFEKRPKPTQVAIKELLDSKLDYKYKSESNS
ncbi:MAG: DNA-directed RNA polymerase subunit omega [Bacteroidota bacterium]|nr:DNA-directed RNA polymerase subunit omega [Bacteroidota bacterium]